MFRCLSMYEKLELIYTMETENLEKDTVLYRAGEVADSMFVISEGWVDISIKFDGNEFALERLTRGSLFN